MAFINQHEHLTKSIFKIYSATKFTNDKMKKQMIIFSLPILQLLWIGTIVVVILIRDFIIKYKELVPRIRELLISLTELALQKFLLS